MKKCLGIEIGHYRIKIAYTEGQELCEYISERIEVDVSDNMKLYADIIREVLKKKEIRCKNAVFVLRQEDTYVRRFKLPLMTTEQLKLNLPYEFQDYTGDQMSAYQYDYIVIERTEEQLDILAAACKKELCQTFQKLAKMAKLKLVGLVPAVVGLEQILETVPGSNEKDYALLDLGTKAIRVHFFRKGVYDITRTLEPGCEEIELIHDRDPQTIERLGLDVDDHFWNDEDEESLKRTLDDYYHSLAVQVMRVLNFYSFNNADNTIDSIYYYGGGSRYDNLIQTIGDTIDLPMKPMESMIQTIDEELVTDYLDSPQAYGVLL